MTLRDGGSGRLFAAEVWGSFVFAYRDLLPVPIFLLVLAIAWKSGFQPGPGGILLDGRLNLVGLILSAAGQGWRFWARGCSLPGTSGRGRDFKAAGLNTRGPYAWVRHPLYLGNFLICGGLALVAHQLWIYPISAVAFCLQHWLIVQAEEAFLVRRFGATYEEWRKQVGCWIPRMRRPVAARPPEPSHEWNFRRAIRKEHDVPVLWITAAAILLACEYQARGLMTPIRASILAGAPAIALSFSLLVRLSKRLTARRLARAHATAASPAMSQTGRPVSARRWLSPVKWY